jgi:hypothetical protein
MRNQVTILHGTTMAIALAALFWVAPVLAGDWECQSDDDCTLGKCFFKSDGNIGRCAEWKPVAENLVTNPKTNKPGIANRQPGDSCAFTVDCLPGYSCYLMNRGSPVGKCLRDTEAWYETFTYGLP